jgi:hypothetical protein
LRLIKPAWHMPIAGVCKYTNVVARSMNAVLEGSRQWSSLLWNMWQAAAGASTSAIVKLCNMFRVHVI